MAYHNKGYAMDSYPPPSHHQPQGYPPAGQSYPPAGQPPPGGGAYRPSSYRSNVVVQPGPDESIARKLDSYMVLSCVVYWCCNCLFGGIAFGLAMMGRDASYRGDVSEAQRLAKWSMIMSVVGVVVTVIIVIVIIILYFTGALILASSYNVYYG